MCSNHTHEPCIIVAPSTNSYPNVPCAKAPEQKVFGSFLFS